DPAGGSQSIEALTDSIEEQVLAYLRRIESLGGTLKAIETGYIQNEIQNSAYAWQRAVESGERIVVGVNRFQQQERPIPTFRLDPAPERPQGKNPRKARPPRTPAAITPALDTLEQPARGSENPTPPTPDAAPAYPTVGKIAGPLKLVFGKFRES